jgi:hypothetical protein
MLVRCIMFVGKSALTVPPTPVHASLGPDHLAMIAKGVSAIVSSADLAGRPSIMRAVGSAVEPDAPGGLRITVFLSRPQSRQLLLDIAATGRVAVVFSEPCSHRTVQVKASHVQVRAAGVADEPALAQYRLSMEHEVGLVGFGPEFVRAMLGYRLEELVAVELVPEQAFDQSPGPRAGAAIGNGPDTTQAVA